MKKLATIKTLTIASLSVLVLAVSISLAQTPGRDQNKSQGGDRHGHGKGWGDRGGHMDGMMLRGLNLTEDQKTKIKQISQSFRERTQPLHQELQAKRQELRQANEGGTFNETLATQKLQESASLQAKLMGEQFRMRQEMLSVLTPEQKAQLDQQRAQFKGKGPGREWRKDQ